MIGIVILNYQNWEDTFCCVQSIWDNPPNESFQIILVDNASPNMPEYDLDAMIQEYEILYIKNKENKGYNAGNNIGIAKALEIK